MNDGLWKCHGCGQSGNASQLASLLGVDPPEDRERTRSSLREVAKYTYQDETGKPLFQVRRYSPKHFYQFRSDGNGDWLPGLKGTRRVLYRLPEIFKSPIVYVVEGEKDAEMLRAWKIPATTNPGGAGKWRPEYSEFLKGKAVVIIPDRDPPGEKHGREVACSLWGKAKAIKILLLPKGKDIAAWKESGGTIEELKRLVEATPVLKEAPKPDDTIDRPGPLMVRLSDVVPEELHWLWKGRIAKGKLCLLIGDPGLGKSFVTLDIASRISKASQWPDGGIAPSGDVILLSAEDGIADTIRPRIDRLGGDPKRIHVLKAVRSNGAEQSFSLVTDLPHLETSIRQTAAVLVVIDPLSAYLGKTESYKDSEVRGVLSPLQALADRTGVAVLGVMHMTKDSSRKAIYRAPGSIGFIGAARIALAVAMDPDNEERRLLMPIKSNICAKPDSLAFSIHEDTLQWEPDPVMNVNPDDVLAGPSGFEEKEEHRDADQFLREMLRGGEVAASEIFKENRKNGISEKTIRRAKSRLHILSRRVGLIGTGGAWYWSLPPENPSKTANLQDVTALDQPIENSQDFTRSSPKAAISQVVTTLENQNDRLGIEEEIVNAI